MKHYFIGAVVTGLVLAATVQKMSGEKQKPAVFISANGIAMLKKLEGFSATPYKDEAGLWTIGYGSRINDAATWGVITKRQAEKMMLEHIAADIAVIGLVQLSLPQRIFDAICMLAYNVGPYSIRNSKMLAAIKRGDLQGAYKEWDWYYITLPNGEKMASPGLVNRRVKERALLINGVYSV